MKVVVRDTAARDLEGVFDWISRDNPAATIKVLKRISQRIDDLALGGFPDIGRPGLVEGTRELVEPPYIIVYEVDRQADELTILAVFHGAQDRNRD